LAYFLIVVGWSDFAMAHTMHTEDGEPDGIAEGQTSNASQQSKHFQSTSATVLCGTVNSKALTRHGDCSGNCRQRHFECALDAPRRDFAVWPIDMPQLR
jgi:hypothetical protein